MVKKKRGLALVTVLFMAVPLVMLLGATISLVGHGTFTSLTYQDRMEAFYAAEAGIVYAIEQLELDNDWAPSSVDIAMPNGRSRFRLSFGTSRNNLNEVDPADGPRGPDTVPPDSVDLVVTGTAGAAERTLEVIIERRGTLRIEEPIMASGKIHLRGEIQIQGVKDINDWEKIPAGLHSNYDEDVADVVTWQSPGSAGTATISGDVSAVSSSPGAVNVAGPVDGDILTQQPKRLVKDYDVVGEIALHSSSPAPPPPDATGTINLVNGDYYVSGDFTVNGKLNLQNANLYVANGNLNVTGSLVGAGSIYVDGETHFRGDSRLAAADPDFDQDPDVGVGLLSTGNVSLTGYDGEQYMNDLISTLPANDPVPVAWSDSQRAIDEMVGLLDTHTWDGFDAATKDEFDSVRRVLGQTLPNPIPSWASGQNQIGFLATALASEPPHETRDFLIEKFESIAMDYDSPGTFYPGPDNAATAIQAYIDTGDTRGFIDASLDTYYDGIPSPLDPAFRSAAAMVQRLDNGGLGDSFFQGVIYTEGYLVASNHVTVLGGVITNAQRGPDPGLQPGDVQLTNGATIIYPEEMFHYGRGVGGTGQLGVRSWISK